MKPIESKFIKRFKHEDVWIDNVIVFFYYDTDEGGDYGYIITDIHGNELDECWGFLSIEDAYGCAGVKTYISLKKDD